MNTLSELFKNHLQKFTEISEEDFPDLLNHFQEITVKKKANLLMEGQVCRSNYFVLKGCLRKFFINEKGTEQTTDFAIESWWMTDNLAYERQTISNFHIQAVENTVVLKIDYPAQERLLERHPSLERYFRFIYQRAYAASQMRIKYLYSFSKEDFYHHLVQQHPEFVKRIPQYLIASFLGFTPEYLSEIRAKRIS